MSNLDVSTILGQTDIYLVDQIMKNRYQPGDVLLDAGCGRGRNLHWFLRNNIDIYGIDAEPAVIEELKQMHGTRPPERFRVGRVEATSFEPEFFDGIISSAVLHFANDIAHFFAMMSEMHRVLKWEGTLFIRMASDIGIEEKVQPVSEGVFQLPDGSTRFLLTRQLLAQVMGRYSFSFLEELKIVNVNDRRCMSTLVLKKERAKNDFSDGR